LLSRLRRKLKNLWERQKGTQKGLRRRKFCPTYPVTDFFNFIWFVFIAPLDIRDFRFRWIATFWANAKH
jgi:hypothetical protein